MSNVLRSVLRYGFPVFSNLKRPLHPALDIIDSIHRDGALPRIPVRVLRTSSTDPPEGQYVSRSGKALAIEVRDGALAPLLTLIHEVGHFLDHQAIGTPGEYASETHPILQAWRAAVNASAMGQEWERLKRDGTIPYTLSTGGTLNIPVDPVFAAYASSPVEQFARCYVQYIVHKSGDATLDAQFHEKWYRQWPYPMQWEDQDFQPVLAAMDALMDTLGWRER